MQISGAKTKPLIVFFGTGPVAADSLTLLMQSFDIEAVITKPRPPHHRGSFPVLEVAQEAGLPVLTVSTKQDVTAAVLEQKFQSRVAVLIDFGIIVTQDVIDTFLLGIINSHFSLLPEWRGADPITFALLSGQERTGVSLMKLVEAMDEGPLLAVGTQDDITTLTTPELTTKLVQLSYELLRKQLPAYITGESTTLIDQADMHRHIDSYPDTPSYSRKLTKADGLLDFTKSAKELEREIRAFHEWPKSRTRLAHKDVVILQAHVVDARDTSKKPGDAFIDDKQLCVQTSDGVLVVTSLKPAGKQAMSAESFLAGYGKNL